MFYGDKIAHKVHSWTYFSNFLSQNFENRKATLEAKHLRHKAHYRPKCSTRYKWIIMDKKNKCLRLASTNSTGDSSITAQLWVMQLS